ncbi:MAG: ribonuclease T2 [Parvularculaceae bacterium]|nr:ribonuclease T2 [Parvularculaceae bacterium]
MRLTIGLALAAFFAMAAPSLAEAPTSRAPASTSGDKPGVFDYYALVLSWTPTYCAELDPGRADPQCDARGRPFAFVLHGLWPQYARGWPERCQTANGGFVPRAVADRMRDIMPNAQLVFHEYRRHGTCSGLAPDAYFDLSRKLFEKVTIPPAFRSVVGDRMTIAPAALEAAFIAANPGLSADGIAVSCGGTGDRLKDVRICFNKSGAFRRCGENENQARLCRAARVFVPPVRAGAGR